METSTETVETKQALDVEGILRGIDIPFGEFPEEALLAAREQREAVAGKELPATALTVNSGPVVAVEDSDHATPS